MARIHFADLPEHVRAAVERLAGASVVDAVSQPGGFSPGTADRLLLADGRRVFVKAVSPEQNPHTPDLHRREIAVTAALPGSAPTPRLIGSFDDGFWVALVLDDIAGRHPHEPWTASELDACLAALDRLAVAATPCPVPGLPDLVDELRSMTADWERVADDPRGVAASTLEHLDELAELAGRSVELAAGDTLVHLDIRADNLLVRTEGPRAGDVVVVDWPWASHGCDWFDTLALVLNAQVLGCVDADPDQVVRTTPRLRAVPASDIDAMLAAFAGYFTQVGRLPDAPGLPTLREFQRRQGAAVLAWLGRRRGW